MAAVKTKRFMKKPLYVEAVRITRRNFNDVAKWSNGRIQTDSADHPQTPGARYIKIDAHNPISTRQTKAYLGDWVLKTDRGFKIYSDKAFGESFDESEYPRMDGGFVVIGPECYAQHDGSVLSWKGVNYIPQSAENTVEVHTEAKREAMS
jgi:hypothetical protein